MRIVRISNSNRSRDWVSCTSTGIPITEVAFTVAPADFSSSTGCTLLPLTELPQGMSATVQIVKPQSEALHSMARRLAEIGFLPGETVRVLRRVAGGEPIAVRIGSSTFALRKYEAQCITVRC